ncbi:hypothetical protein [Streptomyces apocyni]|uniref:hypothetical protein n=1 Tax=Streptomyces apocyni TaxID=2654677 RepID=UPI0012EA5C0B|nr:hypothetical protein [Streptomyces apocyni]
MRSSKRRTVAAAIGAALAVGVLATSCGDSGDSSRASVAKNTLTAGKVSVTFPSTWQQTDPTGDLDAVAELHEGGTPVGRLSVRRDFSTASSVAFAAHDARRTYTFGGGTQRFGKVEHQGVPGDVFRIDYPERESPGGGEGLARKGARVLGTDVVAAEGKRTFFLVRLNYVSGQLTSDEVDAIVDSVAVSD